MKFSVGYQIRNDNAFIESIIKNKASINEIYFPWEDFPNGRNSSLVKEQLSVYEARKKRDKDFELLFNEGLGFNLLLNGNCYGKHAQSRVFFCKIGDSVDYLVQKYSLSAVTTTSPLIAKFLKQNFPDIDVRASVNMEIDPIQGMDYIADWFDSFYLKREYNRDISKIIDAKEWCDQNGKRLYGLANSGCLNFCSAHTFHDNLVSHESEIAQMDNAYQFEGQCWQYLKKNEKRSEWLRITNFIRPEDVSKYENLFNGLKLATRVAKNPFQIIEAYCKGSFLGNLPDLLEPNHAGVFYPEIIENKKIPDSFAEKVLNCQKNCKECGYCNNIQKNATIVL